jgi:signal transduction histidine kinase
VRRRSWLLLLPAAVVLGIAGERFSIRAYPGWHHWLGFLDLAVGWAFIAAGLFGWRRRPENRTGPIMAAVGFTFFIGDFQDAGAPVLISLGTGFAALSLAVLAHLVLAYPTGRLGRAERVLAIVIYSWVIGQGLGLMLTYDPSFFYRCAMCPQGGLAAFPSLSVYSALTTFGTYMEGALAFAVLVLLVRRFVRSTPALRRALGALWATAVLTAVVVTAQGLIGLVGSQSFTKWVLRVVQDPAELLISLALLYGLFRSRIAQSAVADLVRELGKQLGPGQLRDVLARTLGDPSAELVFWREEAGEFMDEEGRPFEIDLTDERRAVTRLESGGRLLGALIHDPGLLADRRLIDAAGTAAGLALENERLHAEIRAQLEEVRASRARIVKAADAERWRLERDLHDGAQQRLVTMALALRVATEQLDGANPAVRLTLEEASEELARALSELRELARGIHPSILTEAGLGPALESLAERSSIQATVIRRPTRRLGQDIEAGAYFVVSESLANAAKHSNARCVRIDAREEDGWLVVDVADDGSGGADSSKGSGLKGLADRAAALNGRLEIVSSSGGGTMIRAEIPCG